MTCDLIWLGNDVWAGVDSMQRASRDFGLRERSGVIYWGGFAVDLVMLIKWKKRYIGHCRGDFGRNLLFLY